MPDFYLRVVLFQGETPTKILSGTPTQLNANVNTGAGQELRVIDQTQRTTSGLTRTLLAEDARLNLPPE